MREKNVCDWTRAPLCSGGDINNNFLGARIESYIQKTVRKVVVASRFLILRVKTVRKVRRGAQRKAGDGFVFLLLGELLRLILALVNGDCISLFFFPFFI